MSGFSFHNSYGSPQLDLRVMFRALLIVLHLATLTSSFTGKDCGSYNNFGFEKHLGTKTPYRFLANLNDSQPFFEGCHPVKILGVIRHGTRTPGRKFKKNVETRLKFLRGVTDSSEKYLGDCENERNKLKEWEIAIESDEDKALTHEGEDEMIDLAERFQKRFPSLLDVEYSNDTFLFKSTDTQRTRQSAFWFSVGLFGRWVSHNRVWFPESIYKDPILRFYKLCKKWKSDVKDNVESQRELEKYKTSVGLVKQTIEAVSARLNLSEPLNYDDLLLMYVTCSFETAWRPLKAAPLCSIFSTDDFRVMEYGEELKYYWRDGYGYELNYAQACPLTRNIFNFLRDDNTGYDSVFYFTHSGTILKLISRLGLYKDNFKLTHDLEDSLKDIRQWKISLIDAFSSNIVFVLYRCSNELKLLTMHQERPVTLPGCPSEGLCPFDLAMKIFGPFVDECDFNSQCSLD